MKLYAYCLGFLLAFSPGLQSVMGAQTLPSYEIGFGPSTSRTKLPYLDAALQPGFRVQASILLGNADQTAPSPIGRFVLDYFRLERSWPQSDGNLYRAWQGFSAGFLGGMRIPVTKIPFGEMPVFARLEAGLSVSATKYTGTGLVSANPSIRSRFGMDIDVFKGLGLGIDIPLELAFKSGGTAFMTGLVFSLRYR
jgi:hypothetical protein